MKKLIPAIAMLLVVAAMLGTSTYAWFSMNKTVSATGLTVKARSEGGIVIARTIKAADTTNHIFTKDERKTLDVTVDMATPAEAVALLPTSTADATNWYHANALASNAYNPDTTTYETLSANAKWEITDIEAADTGCAYGQIDVDPSGTGDELVYFLMDEVSILPDAQASTFDNLWVSYCNVDSSSNELSKALRVAIVCDGTVVICAPITGATTSYKVNQADTAISIIDSSAATATSPLAADIAAAGTKKVALKTEEGLTQVDAKIYVYFEGEDAEQYTDNYTAAADALDELTVTVGFRCTTVHAGAADATSGS